VNVGERGVHDEAVGRSASGAAVAKLRHQRAGDGLLQVGVGEDEEGRVAAELHGRADDGTGGVLEQDAADLG
jgi:hypothetical protein